MKEKVCQESALTFISCRLYSSETAFGACAVGFFQFSAVLVVPAPITTNYTITPKRTIFSLAMGIKAFVKTNRFGI